MHAPFIKLLKYMSHLIYFTFQGNAQVNNNAFKSNAQF